MGLLYIIRMCDEMSCRAREVMVVAQSEAAARQHRHTAPGLLYTQPAHGDFYNCSLIIRKELRKALSSSSLADFSLSCWLPNRGNIAVVGFVTIVNERERGQKTKIGKERESRGPQCNLVLAYNCMRRRYTECGSLAL